MDDPTGVIPSLPCCVRFPAILHCIKLKEDQKIRPWKVMCTLPFTGSFGQTVQICIRNTACHHCGSAQVFFVNTAPLDGPTNLAGCPRPMHLHEALEVGESNSIQWFERDNAERYSEHMKLLPLDVLSKELHCTEVLSKDASMELGQIWAKGWVPPSNGSQQQGVQRSFNKSQQKRETFEFPSWNHC